MNRPSLSQLYRRFAGNAAAPLSVQDADLMRFSRDLEPVSAQLSADLSAALAASPAQHRRTDTSRRIATSRRWRGAAALAASLIAAIAVWSAYRPVAIRDMPTAQNVPAAAVNDRIFAGLDDNSVASRDAPVGDEIFRSEFLPDEIFNSKVHDG
jgi:hypothetical protein